MSKEDISLQDEIRAAFASSNAKAEDEDISNKEVIDALEEDEDKGKDVSADGVEDAGASDKEGADKEGDDESAKGEAEGAQSEATKDVKLTDSKAPSSWSPKVREKWKDLPEEVRSEIIRREEASVNGVRKLQEEYAPLRDFAQRLDPFVQEAKQAGLDAGQYITNVMAAERALRAPDPQQRVQALLSIADQYGVPLRQMLNQSAGKELFQQPQTTQLPPEIMRELEEARRWREQSQESSIQSQIEMFRSSKEHEFYEDVRDIMADLIEAGRAKDLKDAYEQAIWLNPEVRSVLIDRENNGRKQEDLTRRQAAAASATVKSSGAAEMRVDDEDDDSTEAIIRRAMKGSAGRV